MSDTLTIPGLVCEACGAADLVVICPGTLGDKHELIGRLTRDAPTRAWCSIECARTAGWPWLSSEAVTA